MKRLELLRHVAEQQGTLNTRQLAQALGRDYKNVHTDVSALEDLGLIEKGEKGVLTVPYDEIAIHAGAVSNQNWIASCAFFRACS